MQTTLDRPTPSYLEVINDVVEYRGASAFMKAIESRMPNGPKDQSKRGNIFADAFAEVLLQEKIGPVMREMEYAYAPEAEFDYILYRQDGFVITFALKVSFRERWKQASSAARIVRGAQIPSKHYIMTLSADDDRKRKDDIKRNPGGLDECILATSDDLDRLIRELKGYRFADEVPAIPMFRYRRIQKH